MVVSIIRKLFYIVLFIVATFCFVVLFEHGPGNFVENAKKEFDQAKAFRAWAPERRKDDPSKIAR